MVITTQALLLPLGIEVNVAIFDQATRVQMGHEDEGHLFSTGLLDSEPGSISLFYHSKNLGSFNTVLALNLLGDGLRDLLDPRLRS